MNNEKAQTPSVYRRGAEEGWKLGIYMVVTFLFSAYSMRMPILGLASMIMLLLTPVPVYVWLRRDYLRYPATRFFSAVWMQGIALFFFASVILAASMYVFLRFIEPDFIIENVRQSIEVYAALGKEVPDAAEIARMLQQMVDQNLLPSAITMSVTMIWTVTFFGSMLSLLLTFVVRFLCRKTVKNEMV